MHWAPKHAQRKLKIVFDKEVWILILGLDILIFEQIITNPALALVASIAAGVFVQRIIDTKPRGYLQHLVHRYVLRIIPNTPSKGSFKA